MRSLILTMLIPVLILRALYFFIDKKEPPKKETVLELNITAQEYIIRGVE